MRIAIIGAGGVGGYFGARLIAAGEEVHLVARGAHLGAMQRTGLRLRSGLGDLVVAPVHATADPGTIGPVDLVMIAVKLWSTAEAMESAGPLVGPGTALVSFQNGVEAADLAAGEFGPEHVLGGVAHIAALIEEPGVIRHNGTLARLTFGEFDGKSSPRARALLAACEAAGVDAVLSADIRGAIWEKFVFLVAVAGMTALTRLPIGPIRTDPVCREMLQDAMAEVVVASSHDVRLPADVVERQMSLVDRLPPDMVSSMLGDLRRGHRLELEWLSGAVARMGSVAGVATPRNQAIYAALRPHAGGAPA